MNKKIIISLLVASVLMIIVSLSGVVYASLTFEETNSFEALTSGAITEDTPYPFQVETGQRWSTERLIYTDGTICMYEGYAIQQTSPNGNTKIFINVPKVISKPCP